MTLEEKLSADHDIKINGAVLLSMLEGMMFTIVDGMRRGDGLSEDEQIDYAIGLFLFKEAQRIFGDKFVTDFCTGKDVIPPAPIRVNGNSTIN